MLPLVPSDCCPAMTTRRPNKRRKGLGVVTADHPSPYIILGGVTRPGQHSQNKHMQNTTSTIFAHLTDCQLLADPGNHVGGGWLFPQFTGGCFCFYTSFLLVCLAYLHLRQAWLCSTVQFWGVLRTISDGWPPYSHEYRHSARRRFAWAEPHLLGCLVCRARRFWVLGQLFLVLWNNFCPRSSIVSRFFSCYKYIVIVILAKLAFCPLTSHQTSTSDRRTDQE